MIEVVDKQIVINPHVVKFAPSPEEGPELEERLPRSDNGNSFILSVELFEKYQHFLEEGDAIASNKKSELGYGDNTPYWNFLGQLILEESAESDADFLVMQSRGQTMSRKTLTVNSLAHLRRFEVNAQFPNLSIRQTEETWVDNDGNERPQTEIVKEGTQSQAVSEDQSDAEAEAPTPQQPAGNPQQENAQPQNA